MEKYINLFTDFGFKKIFGTKAKDRLAYEDSKKHYLDLNSALYTAKREEKIANTKNAILEGLDNHIISKITGLNIEEIEKIRKEINQSF